MGQLAASFDEIAPTDKLADLRTAIRRGIESGPATPLDIADIKQRARAALAERSAPERPR